ncbi:MULTISPECIES: transposase [unclassified Halomonas]|uniref:REP-associated tyrosine transposase n=1 Tax=unclassified Halomonas TaxID=2609666 RepID=UPI00209D7019|nr:MULTISPECIES: transposase [unclassified Halomonas]MCP1315009.1 transposase [Halomonas sp. 707D7]MCP1328343.1 transposase [Halomonas sp. 707D4]
MATYRRALIPGGTYFFTVVTCRRQPLLAKESNITALGRAFRRVRHARPFTLDAFVILPDHLHCLWTLPEGDADYSSRWRDIKKTATREFLLAEGSDGAWQRGFWEHVIRDDHDWQRHMDYIHFNPVKHGYVAAPSQWRWSSFKACVKKGWYEEDWSTQQPPAVADMNWE